MADSEVIAVTGSTGYVGRETSSALTRIRLPSSLCHTFQRIAGESVMVEM
ncbi:MAG: hypothetical protein CM15mP49_26080 [Actinomycetota bacterium]|nr:MAG: hypothetical protein CM15mP49_26080 [Actinomycetota bacterium]